VTSRLVTDDLDAFSELACLRDFSLVFLPGHRGTFGNEESDKLGRQAPPKLLYNPE
jgi:hypothetical protein